MVGQKIQPNPTHYKGPTQLTWVGLDHGLKKNLIAIIIIKLNIRITSLQIREKYNQIILSITSNQHKPYEENLGFEFYLGKR